MDPDPFSLYSVFLSHYLLFSFSAIQLFLVFITIGAFGVLGWLYSVERVLADVDVDFLEALKEGNEEEYYKLSKLYCKSNRLSTVFALAKIFLAVFIILCVYFVLGQLDLNVYLIASIIIGIITLPIWLLRLPSRITKDYLHMGINIVYHFLNAFVPIANIIVPKEQELPKEDISMEELKTVLPTSEEEQPSIANLNLYKQVLRFDKVKIRHVMRPKRELEGIKSNYNFNEVLHKIKSSSHSRLPVYEGNWSKILGIIHCKDLLPYTDREALDWKKMIRPIIYVQERDNAQAVLRTFQQSKNHMALVLSTSKRLVGLVTLEDITEEIIGEIEDE